VLPSDGTTRKSLDLTLTPIIDLELIGSGDGWLGWMPGSPAEGVALVSRPLELGRPSSLALASRPPTLATSQLRGDLPVRWSGEDQQASRSGACDRSRDETIYGGMGVIRGFVSD
jgi:hypothetical protein